MGGQTTKLLIAPCQVEVCQRGWAGRPWARNPKTPHFYWLGLGRPGPPQPLTFIDGPGPARPPKSLTFIDGPWASGPPKSFTFIDGARPDQPLTSIPDTLLLSIPTPYWLATGSIHRLDTSSSAASCEWLPDRG